MNQEKYIGMDAHQATISVAVMDAGGKVIMEGLLETKAATIVEFIQGLQGTLSLTFEEGTSAAWLHDLLKPHVSRLVVCDPKKNAPLKDGNKSDRIDARKLAELLRTNQLKPVYHGEHGVRTLKELGRSYLTLTQDGTRVMNRIKALYRSWAIPCSGSSVYAPRHRAEWLAKIVEPGVRIRAQWLYQQLDGLQPVHRQARRELLQESHRHPAVKLLRQIPSIGPIRSALLVALLQTPHRFRTKRQLWAYSGFAVEGFGTTFAAVPDLVAMLKRRSSAGMNPRMTAIMGAFQVLWVYYGLLTLSRPVIAWNIVAVLINFLSVGAYLYFVRKERAEPKRVLGS